MEEFNDQEQIRRQRRQQMLAEGRDPYPARTTITTTVARLRSTWELDQACTIGGRIRAIRVQGGSAFLDIDDGTGKVQLFVQKKQLGDDFVHVVKELDLGDIIEATGITFVTKAGEQTVNVSTLRMLAKALRPLPSSWHGIEDVELRYRHRELDLVTNADTTRAFQQRSAMVQAVRAFLLDHAFIEVETPILQTLAGGASAKPFITHHEALDIDLYLRVAPELYLKRLIVGGMPRVFEVARCFRNEGIDRDHNPEFTQIELYAAYQDYQWLMIFTEQLIHCAAIAANGRSVFFHQDGEVAIPETFPRHRYRDLVLERTAIDIDEESDEALLTKARAAGVDVPTGTHRMKVIDELFKTCVRPTIISPTIVFDYPADMIPLAKRVAGNPNYVECFQVLMGGTELSKGFTELNDPIDQRQRFESQEAMRAEGDDEAQRIDEDFLQALEYGMPPTAGLGIGIDRLIAIMTGQRALKEVILFPTLKPSA